VPHLEYGQRLPINAEVYTQCRLGTFFLAVALLPSETKETGGVPPGKNSA